MELHEYDVNNMVQNPAICIIGRRSAGKTYVSGSILTKLHVVPDLVFCPTDQYDPMYPSFVPL